MGLKRAFTEQADFGDMIKNEALQISKVVQKAFIEVNEEGSEAAAATGLMYLARTMPLMDTKKDFLANHPFFFSLKSGSNVLFYGKLVKP
ncbi:uncharacterized protein LOC126749734 isoform X8 [Anthonomus grandis grandis]|uniref:uncharacterized protein LOC126749734 isoform X8 n=1 Tax=Anthonomus grandis grandis TaxID=2921223 RepID=UPI0021665685|nr:uncharacterized protein LOC126749734 isoform X8 [Anthonomus grandis grandis]